MLVRGGLQPSGVPAGSVPCHIRATSIQDRSHKAWRGGISWGSIRKLNSGRYQARYRFEGIQYTGPTTFRTKSEANAWLAGVRVDLDRGAWIDPDAGSISLADFATAWLAERPGLRPRTRELYESELRLHILPVLGDLQLRQLSSARGPQLACRDEQA